VNVYRIWDEKNQRWVHTYSGRSLWMTKGGVKSALSYIKRYQSLFLDVSQLKIKIFDVVNERDLL
jgi:hypothetical protein